MNFSLDDLMFIVLGHARKSPDPSTQNAAILLKPDSYGKPQPVWATLDCNRFPDRVNGDIPERWERPKKYKFVSHAESNSLTLAGRHCVSTVGSFLLSPWVACDRCAVQIINSGISKIYTLARPTSERWDDSIAIADEMFEEAKIEFVFLDKRYGVEILRNGVAVVV